MWGGLAAVVFGLVVVLLGPKSAEWNARLFKGLDPVEGSSNQETGHLPAPVSARSYAVAGGILISLGVVQIIRSVA